METHFTRFRQAQTYQRA